MTELFQAYLTTGLLGVRLILVQETNLLADWLADSDGWNTRVLSVRNEGSSERRLSARPGLGSGTLEVSWPAAVFLVISDPDTEIIDLRRFLLSFSQLSGVRPSFD